MCGSWSPHGFVLTSSKTALTMREFISKPCIDLPFQCTPGYVGCPLKWNSSPEMLTEVLLLPPAVWLASPPPPLHCVQRLQSSHVHLSDHGLW